MSSIDTRRSTTIDEDLQAQKTIKRKQGSTLRSLKESFKFRGSGTSKKISPQSGSSTQSSPSKVRRNSTDARKAKQRLSAQRVSLFKYDNVRALSSSMPSDVRRGSDSTVSSNTTRSSDPISLSSNRSRSSVKVKPTTLMARGTLEIYQIYTPNANTAEKRQEMNYLSLGRKENIVHPILPRLQVSKATGLEHRFIIHFYNPDRFWEIEFLPVSDSTALSNVVKDFEKVIGTICDYSKSGDSMWGERKSSVSKKVQNKISNGKDKELKTEGEKVSQQDTPRDDQAIDDDDDLSYLLEESEEITERPISNVSSADIAQAVDEADEDVNKAFRKAMHNFKPSCTYRGANSERFNDYSSKRFSSYQSSNNPFEQYETLPRRASLLNAERSLSVRSWFGDQGSIHVTKRGTKKFT